MKANATFHTEKASRYLATLCKHFNHKVPVRFDTISGEIELPFGQCELKADGVSLALAVEAANQSDLDKTIRVITNHLERFAFRENPKIDWTATSHT